jgi:hypothetical protein
MTFELKQAIRVGAAVVAVLTSACGGSGSSSSCVEAPAVASKQEQLTERPSARLFLTDDVVARLQQRAAAGDPAWTELAAKCDGWATGTMHAPNGSDYAKFPSVGEGYQGDEYLPVIRGLGLCYRTVRGVNAEAEARYAAAGGRLLEAMSTPPSAGGMSPATNWGYGIRHYGVGMAIGYDWLYPALSSSLRERVITSLNTWIDWYDGAGFLRNEPIGNYFAGYLLAKTTAAIATEGDNPKASAYWQDVETRLWGTLAKEQFGERLRGGGWPEGWGYGKKAVLSIAETLWAAKTAKNLDWWSELPQLTEQARYVTYFAWPSLKHMDDQGTIRAGTHLRASAELTSGLSTILQASGDGYAGKVRGFADDIVATAGDDREPWARFLYGDPNAARASYTDQPLSYVAEGPGHVAMRSTWDKDAVWAELAGGSYINAPDSAEQMFNSGSISVVQGDTPILINATGWIPQVAGSAGENFVHDDAHGQRQRRLYNTFFVDDASNLFNPGQNNFGPDQSKAHVERYEDGGGYVRARAANIEDQYGWRGTRPVSQFTRDVVYVRPGTFVVFDRTAVAAAGADQWMSFHTASTPTAAAAADPTTRRFDVTAGNIRTLLPRNADVKTVALPGGTARLEVHAPERNNAQQWLTVVSAGGGTAEQTRLSAADGNVTAGDAVGVHVRGERDQVVVFSAEHSGVAALSSVEYVVAQAAAADHVVVDVAPSSNGYAIAAMADDGGALRISVTPGGPFMPSAASVLSFSVGADGHVEGTGWVAPAPIETTALASGEKAELGEAAAGTAPGAKTQAGGAQRLSSATTNEGCSEP